MWCRYNIDFNIDFSNYFNDDFNYIFDGKTNLNDLYKAINIKDKSVFENKKGDSETIAGFILEQMGYFPKKGSVLKINNVKFVIEEMDRKRIKRIRVKLKK